MKFRFASRTVIQAGAAVFLSSVMGFAQAQWDGTLPAPGNPVTSQQYQDFTIFSLNYLDNLNSKTGVNEYPGLPSPGYNVPSNLGYVSNQLVSVTGNTGAPASNFDLCGGNKQAGPCDNAYDYPPPQGLFFSSFATPDPSVAVPGEPTRSTWTAQTSALRSFLGGFEMIFMFNLNEDSGGAPNTLDGQALLVAARVQLTDAAGNVMHSFYIGANSSIPLPFTARQVWESGLEEPEADPTNTIAGQEGAGADDDELYDAMIMNAGNNLGFFSADPRWAYVHGQIAVDATTGVFLGFGTCGDLGLSNCETINQNLGANQVAFSAFNQQLSDLVNDPNNGIAYMNVDFVTSGQSNGFEQLFITRATVGEGPPPPPPPVPEPATLALVGIALAGLGAAQRRRKAR